MERELRLVVFWILHLIMLGLFGLGMLFFLSVWLKSRVPGLPANASRWRKLGAAIGYMLGIIFSRRIWTLLRALVVDGMVHRRLYRTSFRRWIAHIAVFGSFLVLGILSTITGVVVEFLPLFGMRPEAVASIPLFGHFFHADVWWIALINDLLGLVILGGMLMVIYRRYVAKDPQLRTIPADNAIIFLLTLIVLTGFVAEAFRLLALYTTPAGVFAPAPNMLPVDKFPRVLYPVWGPQWGFAGYALAWVLGQLGIGPGVWEVLDSILFWLHFVVVTALLYYLPFSRFAHVIMSPVIVAYNTMMDEESRQHRTGSGSSQHSGRGVPRPAA